MAEQSTNTLFNWWLKGQVPVDANGNSVPPTSGGSVPNSITTSSVSASGKATAPAQFATIVSLGPLTGLYKIEVSGLMNGTGTIAATDVCNMQFVVGNSGKFRIILSAKDFVSVKHEGVFRFNNENAIVNVLEAGAANVDYWATIIATKIGA